VHPAIGARKRAAVPSAGKLACVAGVNGEGEGEGKQERGRKMGDWGLHASVAKRGKMCNGC